MATDRWRSPVFGLPSPASDRSWTLAPRTAAMAGIRAEGADTDWCALRVASVVGVRHRVVGRSVEDSWAWDGDADRIVFAVADGLGSYPNSAPVAAAVAAVAVAAATAAVDPDASFSDALAAANEAVQGQEEGKSTLVLAAVSRDGTADLVRVGDSTAFTLVDGVWTELFDPEDDGMRRTTTSALPAAEPQTQMAHVTLGVGELLVLVSDGVGDPLRDGPTTVAPGLAAALGSPLHPLELAVQTDFSRKGCGDDRTVVALWFGLGTAPKLVSNAEEEEG